MYRKECCGDGIGAHRSDCGAEFRLRVEGEGRVDDEGRLLEETDTMPCRYAKKDP